MRRALALSLVLAAACGGAARQEFGDLVITALEKDGADHTITLNGAVRIAGVRLEAGGKGIKWPGRDRFPDVKVDRGEEGRLAAAVKAGATGEGGAALRVTDVKIRPFRPRGGGDSKLKAFATVELNGGLLTISAKVVEGRNGLFVGLPSKKVGGEYEDTVKIVDGDLKRAFDEAVLAAYNAEGGAAAAGGETGAAGGGEGGAAGEDAGRGDDWE